MSNKHPPAPSVIGSTIMPHMSARARTQIMDELFFETGGKAQAKAWIEKSDENYGKFLQWWAKGQMKPQAIEQAQEKSIEDLLHRLDAGEHAKVINGHDGEP
jgi:hypothetical protein